MNARPKKSLQQLVSESGRYPEAAYHFIRSGLSFAVDRIHGKMTAVHRVIQQYMADENLDLDDLAERIYAAKLPKRIQEAIRQVGGLEKLNRHIGGQDLCWGLRDYCIRRWGPLAPMVLARWGIRETLDFGRIVFDLVDHDFMQKQPHDCLDDFREVYDFSTAFHKSFSLNDAVEEESSTSEPDAS